MVSSWSVPGQFGMAVMARVLTGGVFHQILTKFHLGSISKIISFHCDDKLPSSKVFS